MLDQRSLDDITRAIILRLAACPRELFTTSELAAFVDQDFAFAHVVG